MFPTTHPPTPTEAFTYDGVGNRLSSADHSNGTYDDNNRLTSYNGTTYTHDENGNMVTKTDASGTTTYTYDSENKLTGIDFPGGGFVEYVYDGLGRRIEKNVGGTITRYVYDLEDILFEYNGSNTITARYTHGPGIDDPIALERGGQSYFYHTDGLGSITHITDSSKQTIAGYTYDAFGNITSQSGSLANPYTFTGREYDQESGLYYYRARYYDPKIGRFLQPDPLDMAAVILIRQYFPNRFISSFVYNYALTSPAEILNTYLYMGNDPIDWNDPYGLMLKIKIPPRMGTIIKGGSSLGAALLLDYLISNVGHGKLRGSLLIIRGGLEFYSGVQFGFYSVGSFAFAFTTSPSGIGFVGGITAGTATGALAIYSVYLTSESWEQAIREFRCY